MGVLTGVAMIELMASLGGWRWFILGVVLLALEVMAPGTFILWLGLSAILVGLLSLIFIWSWQAQVATFAVLAVASVIVWWRFGRRPVEDEISDQPFLNRRVQAFVGRSFTLDKPIIDGAGTVRIGDTVWRVTGPESAAGSRVKVVRADGPLLVVERAEG
jgi:membrane protein implicated in regulation of membrane protease activity